MDRGKRLGRFTTALSVVLVGLPLGAQTQARSPSGVRAEPDDPTSATERTARELLGEFYTSPWVRHGPLLSGLLPDGCDGNVGGSSCFFGDFDALPCKASAEVWEDPVLATRGPSYCKPRSPSRQTFLELVSRLDQLVRQQPANDFVVGQAVYATVKAGHLARAVELSEECRATGWWCDVLRGYVRHAQGRLKEAEAAFDRALPLMPREERCWWMEIASLLPPEARVEYEKASCLSRRRVEKRAWWLADPLYVDDMNDRRVAHFSRKTQIRLHEQVLSTRRVLLLAGEREFYYPTEDWTRYRAYEGHLSHHELDEALGGLHRGVIAIGFEDSWFHDPASGPSQGRFNHWRKWVSDAGARYRFFPTASALDAPTASRVEDWGLALGDGWERYTPPYGRFVTLTTYQVAWFQALGDSAVVLFASDLTEFSERPRGAGLTLAENENDGGVLLYTDEPREKYIFRAEVAAKPYLASLEVLAPELIGRTRLGTSPPWTSEDSLSASDLLVFEPFGAGRFESLKDVAPLMIGGGPLEVGSELGVYWEVYGLAVGAVAETSMVIERVDSGLLSRVGRLLGARRPTAPTTSWSLVRGETDGMVLGRSIIIDLDDVLPGEYELKMTIESSGGAKVVRKRQVTISGG